MNSIMQKIESLDDVKKRNERKIKLFINSEYPDLIKLGEIMKRCRKKNRCNCLVCSVCLRRFRLQFLKKNLPKLQTLSKYYSLYLATVICNVPVNMATDSIDVFKNWFYDKLKDNHLDGLIFVGGIDYSFNQAKNQSSQPYWCQHLHFIVATNHKKLVQEALSKIFVKDGVRLKKPPQLDALKDFDDIVSVTNYSIPSYFEKRYKQKNGRTSHWSLNSKLEKEIALFLARNSPEDLKVEQNISNMGDAI